MASPYLRLITPRYAWLLACLSLATVGLQGSARATGTPAGVRIESTATATYSVGDATSTISSNPALIVVDELLAVAVASLDGTAVRADGESAVLSFSVTNTGNGPEAFVLMVDPAPNGNDFPPVIRRIALDSNGNGMFDPGIDVELQIPAQTALILPDASTRVFVEVGFPANVTAAGQAQVVLSARPATGTGVPGTTFAGQGELGATAVVGTSSASTAGQWLIVANQPAVALVKSATVVDPYGGAQPMTGAQVTYSIQAQVSGSGSVSDLVITDPLPPGVTYQPASLRLDDRTLSDAADGDAGAFVSGVVRVNLGTASSGANHTITFAVRID
ncbi:MAG: hypothetical protein NTX28_12930 [Novosphingobium sp.]|nr:hypothetical protein [Novosphingobium sp.]